MEREKGFYTLRGYERMRQAEKSVTPSMEDYLEMAYRLSRGKRYTRISDLAGALNVQPPSASRMAQKLAEASYITYEKYGVIELTEKGRRLGSYLLKRHETIAEFLQMIGVTEGLLEETEKIEHSLSKKTVEQIMKLVSFMRENQEWRRMFELSKAPVEVTQPSSQ